MNFCSFYQVHSGQQQLLQLWQVKKQKLDQCLQLRLFEGDCEKASFQRNIFLKQSLAIKSPFFLGKGGDVENSFRAKGERVAIRGFGWCKN